MIIEMKCTVNTVCLDHPETTLHPILRKNLPSRKLVTDQVNNPRQSLNLDHETWCNPWKRQMASTMSFPELFRQSLAKCSTVYYLINQAITSGAAPEDMDFTPVIIELGNYSYHSGLPVF